MPSPVAIIEATTAPLPRLVRSLHERRQPCPEEDNPWMSQEDLAPAWAVSLLTLVALATLIGLAVLG